MPIEYSKLASASKIKQETSEHPKAAHESDGSKDFLKDVTSCLKNACKNYQKTGGSNANYKPLSDLSLEVDEKLDVIETVCIVLNTIDSDILNRAVTNTLENALNDLIALNSQINAVAQQQYAGSSNHE